MALMRCDFFAETLGLSTSMTVILPQQTSRQIGLAGSAGGERDEVPVLYLLHGLSDDDTIWTRRTSIERYAAPLGIAVVMPQVHQSFYADEVHGMPFWTFLTEELPELVQGFFRTSTSRADTFVAGLSMGGYGAMKWALREPHRFAAAASLSGLLGLSDQHGGGDPGFRALMDRAFGHSPINASGNDVQHLLRTADPSTLPALYVACGTEDFLYGESLAFIDDARAAGVDLTTSIGDGDHDWEYWDRTIQDVLAWLPLRTD
jgi:S-formylglutathione hydrolase FrmB